MRTKLMLTAALTMALVGCGDIQGNGDIVEQELVVGRFSGISLAEGLQGDITVGPEASVKIRGDSNLLEYIRLELQGSVLTSSVSSGLGLLPSQPIVVTVITPSLAEVKASNGTDMSVSGLDAEELTVKAGVRSGVSVSGSARRLTLVASGDSEVQAGELLTEVASVEVSGGSGVTVHVTQEISGAASGGSTITVRGSPPQRNLPTSGGSQVHFE
ncbi:MAG: DUF2807 domain-containing protein [Myxococcaceae bacterium]|nr:DUF2807 domain-containing protein [Myxococcaceae bacterium]